jgi:diguanylate cyclase (GGDEF)-like protein
VVEVARARRYSQPLSLLLVAPDNFRDISVLHGEDFANEWLRTIAGVCRQESRTTDVLGRVGGEEFAVLLPSTELSGGLVLAERIRERMQRHVFTGDVQSVRCTLSVGVAEVTDDITSVDALIASASTAVERARQAGMNLSSASTPEVWAPDPGENRLSTSSLENRLSLAKHL